MKNHTPEVITSSREMFSNGLAARGADSGRSDH